MDVASNFMVAYVTYIVGTASPGPANLAIMTTSLQHGRAAGVATASGVVLGSVMWGLICAFGLSAALLAWPDLLHMLSILGGFFLCWLAWRALRAARVGAGSKPAATTHAKSKGRRAPFLYGLGIHLTNPKAMFVWLSVIALGIPSGNRETLLPLLIVAACGLTGVVIFGAYAVVFSNPKVMQGYLRASGAINLSIALLFGAAGLSLLYRSVGLLLGTGTG